MKAEDLRKILGVGWWYVSSPHVVVLGWEVWFNDLQGAWKSDADAIEEEP